MIAGMSLRCHLRRFLRSAFSSNLLLSYQCVGKQKAETQSQNYDNKRNILLRSCYVRHCALTILPESTWEGYTISPVDRQFRGVWMNRMCSRIHTEVNTTSGLKYQPRCSRNPWSNASSSSFFCQNHVKENIYG